MQKQKQNLENNRRIIVERISDVEKNQKELESHLKNLKDNLLKIEGALELMEELEKEQVTEENVGED